MTTPADTARITPRQRARLMRLATYASVATASVLIACKLVAWLWTDSVSLLATLIDSCLDAAASMLNLVAVRHALAPADTEHRFGHGKAESLAGLGQATFIAGSAGFLLLEAAGRLMRPRPPEVVELGVAVMLFSIVATVVLLAIQHHVVRRTDSTAIKADSLHYRTDLLVNISVVAALLLATYGWPGFDALFAIAIAAYILRSAWEIAREAMDRLMDRELSDEVRERIRQIVLSHPEARGMHDLRTRESGTTKFIQLHLELDDDLDLFRAHEIADEVEAMLCEVFHDAEIIIHEDPESLMEPTPPFDERVKKV